MISRQALSAACELRRDFEDFNQFRRIADEPTLEFGLALHVGEVFYGNIGTNDRLDFTVVGPAVNLASRIQDLCRPLACDILVSGVFYDAVGRSYVDLGSAGTHRLHGLRTPQELFSIPAR